MPRPLRIEYENAWYHVMNRGANRQSIFQQDRHRDLFYTLLAEISDRFGVEVHAFCLMKNHYHLLIKTPFANLSRAMRHLDAVYTQRFNRMIMRDGSLFRGRYKAILIDSDQYLLQVSRYIHLNPVLAKICNDPIDYKWSSYQSYVGMECEMPWLKKAFTLGLMTAEDRLSSYIEYVAQGVDEETSEFYRKKHLSSIFGKKEFIRARLNHLDEQYVSCVSIDINYTKPRPKPDEILVAVMSYFKMADFELYRSIQGKRNIAKLIAIYLLVQLANLKHKEIAQIFTSLKELSVPTQLSRFKKMMDEDDVIKGHVGVLVNMVSG